jgi:DnaD/phage-associated family protein
MKGFSGFPARGRMTRIPGLFFSELLPQIDSLNELRVTLYCFWRLQQKSGDVAYVWESEIAGDEPFMNGLAARSEDRLKALQDGLERAVARGTLLHIRLDRRGKEESLYMVNTPRSSAALEGLAQGRWTPSHNPDNLLDLSVERPPLFTVYEQNIGPLTPLIAEKLNDIETLYPVEWIEEAFEIAVTQNKRSMAYVEAILRRWQAEGRTDQAGDEQGGRRFISGKYKDRIEH